MQMSVRYMFLVLPSLFFFNFLDFGSEVFGWVEHAPSLLATSGTSGGLPVVLESTRLTEIVFTPEIERVCTCDLKMCPY